MSETTEQKYTAEEFRHYIGKTIMFEVEVESSERGESNQFPLLMVKDVKECKSGNVVVVGINYIRLMEAKYNMAEEKHFPYRSFKLENIKYGSIKHVID